MKGRQMIVIEARKEKNKQGRRGLLILAIS